MPPNIPLGPHAITQAAQLQSMGFMQRVKALVPYAQLESHKTGLPVNLLLAQWMDESSLGTSHLAQTQNNLAGVGHNASGGYAHYGSLKAFAEGQAAFYNDNSNYAHLLAAAKHGASMPTLLKDLQGSGYAQAPNYGSAIHSLLSSIDASLKDIRKQAKHSNPLSIGPQVHVNTGIPKRKS